jgi:hypothetical protein
MQADSVLLFSDNANSRLELTMFGALYAVIVTLRKKLACKVEARDGTVLFQFDGSRTFNEPLFGQALQDYEHYFIVERQLAQQETLQWVEAEYKNVASMIGLGARQNTSEQGTTSEEPQAGQGPADAVARNRSDSEGPRQSLEQPREERRHPSDNNALTGLLAPPGTTGRRRR